MPAGSRALGSQAQMCGSLQEPRSDCGLPLLGATGGEPTLNASNQHGMGATADSPYFMPSVEEASPGVESSRHRGYELDDGDYDDEDDTDGGRAGPPGEAGPGRTTPCGGGRTRTTCAALRPPSGGPAPRSTGRAARGGDGRKLRRGPPGIVRPRRQRDFLAFLAVKP